MGDYQPNSPTLPDGRPYVVRRPLMEQLYGPEYFQSPDSMPHGPMRMAARALQDEYANASTPLVKPTADQQYQAMMENIREPYKPETPEPEVTEVYKSYKAPEVKREIPKSYAENAPNTVGGPLALLALVAPFIEQINQAKNDFNTAADEADRSNAGMNASGAGAQYYGLPPAVIQQMAMRNNKLRQ